MALFLTHWLKYLECFLRREKAKDQLSVQERTGPIFHTFSIYALIVGSHESHLFSYYRNINSFSIFVGRMSMTYHLVIR